MRSLIMYAARNCGSVKISPGSEFKRGCRLFFLGNARKGRRLTAQ